MHTTTVRTCLPGKAGTQVNRQAVAHSAEPGGQGWPLIRISLQSPPAPCLPIGALSGHIGRNDTARHRLKRITDFPAGIIAPSHVRVYERSGHFVLQWWDPERETNR